MSKNIIAQDWQRIGYMEAWEKQKQFFQQSLERKAQKLPIDNYLFLCEHPPVFTLGKGAKMENLLVSKELLEQEGIALHAIERGGDITFHGLGQCVGYPVLDLDNFGLGARQYVGLLEEVILRLLALYDIQASRLEGATGVWIAGKRKICAIGIRCSRGITMHGFALNVNTDLRYFEYMHPCGIRDKSVTSIAQEIGKEVDFEVLKARLVPIFQEVFANTAIFS